MTEKRRQQHYFLCLQIFLWYTCLHFTFKLLLTNVRNYFMLYAWETFSIEHKTLRLSSRKDKLSLWYICSLLPGIFLGFYVMSLGHSAKYCRRQCSALHSCFCIYFWSLQKYRNTILNKCKASCVIRTVIAVNMWREFWCWTLQEEIFFFFF